ncbi:MAG: LysM peptidoglycan-binding domain-containing protein [Gammaproteobacteria bacterium]|nr:LysM peptidoglycan-binding domain-containing protein [Gammaproteobacteria bacterium]
MSDRMLICAILVVGVILMACTKATTPTQPEQAIAAAEPPEQAPIKKLEEIVEPAIEVVETKIEIESEPKTSRYLVKKGDSLWKIAAKLDVYGDALKWPLIFQSNVARVKDPDLIKPGMVLTIQHNHSGNMAELAIKHAKKRGVWKLGKTEKSDLAFLQNMQ